MRHISSDIVFPANSQPVKNGVVTLDDSGKIIDIKDKSQFQENDIEYYPGFLVPGFINSHCHMELSFMKGAIPMHTGLIEFVKKVVAIRDQYTDEEVKESIINAEAEMLNNGIVAVGDISNDPRSFFQKDENNLTYHTFVEIFDLGPSQTEAELKKGISTFNQVPNKGLSNATITLHAPYSCTLELIKQTDRFTAENGGILSIHLQEHADEDSLFYDKTGAWVDLFKDWGLGFDWFQSTGKSSLMSMFDLLSEDNKLLFIHNTFTSPEDLEYSKQRNQEIFWCFCPSANLYIENRLPDYGRFIDAGVDCVIGTDSLASNHQLSILEEMKIILNAEKRLSFEEVLKWATINGSRLLNLDDYYGSLETGKTPGLVHISNVDLDNLTLTDKSSSIRIA